MTDPSSLPRAIVDWENFYVIVGSSGAALIGLQFVVIALVADIRARSSHDSIGAYATPTIIYFATTLFVAALMSAPWHTLTIAATAIGLTGLGGATYVVLALRRALRQREYRPVLEDWIWFTILPLAAYATLGIGALLLPTRTDSVPFAIGLATLALLLIGIHNAWDAVTYVVVQRIDAKDRSGDAPP